MKYKIFADKNLVVGAISENIYGSFLEHLGRAIYGGIYEPDHPSADGNGFRKDVLSLIKELGVSVVRYPGGNFVSGYDWKDGIGNVAERKTRLDLGWKSIETNEFGTDEFIKWCKAAGTQPMLAFNMGTGTPMDALEYFEYCNHPSGTYFSDLRRKNASEKPYNVKYWCIGNEMDGPWQTCSMDAESYGKKAMQTARMIRAADCRAAGEDGAVKLTVCGSSNREMPSYPEWDRVVLENTYDEIDFLSMHRYYEYDPEGKKPLEDFFCSADDMNEFIDVIRSTIKFVKEKKRSKRNIYISFDEWNIWKQNKLDVTPFWRKAPPILEDVYTLRDALVFGGLMNTLLNNCDVVKVACLAQLVNVIAPIMCEKGGISYRQTIFYTFAFASKNARGETLKTITACDRIEGGNRDADSLNVCVTHNREKREVCVFACNYAGEDRDTTIELRSFGKLKCARFVMMNGEDISLTNTAAEPERVVPREASPVEVYDEGKADLTLKKHSWNFIKFTY
ncbi:MAG: alpha-N-arabinofuranosidase [Clostridia bacterium]|nr:alpha-N-arabinofuranosidase [Clostridia bacterium]